MEGNDDVFFRVYKKAYRSGLVANMKEELWCVLECIASFMDSKGECYPSQEVIARQLGLSRPTENKRIQQLLEFRFNGLPVIERSYILEPGKWKRCRYKVLPESGISIFGSHEIEQRIKKLKTMPYSEYLKTQHWREVRAEALRRASYRCALCSSKNELEVHHNTYERRGEEEPSDVIALCANCHAKHHNI